MGSGSFGGGSGSFGGGGSGGGGGGGGGRGGSGGTDSARERILRLTKLTNSVNSNPEIAKVRVVIYRMLQDRTRSAFFKVTLSDPMVVSAYRALLSLESDLRDGASVAQAAPTVPAGTAPTASRTSYALPPGYVQPAAYEEPPQFSNDVVASPGPVRTAQGAVNPYAQPPVIQPLAGQVERIEEPGAARSTVPRPTFENHERPSRLSVDATETTLGSSIPDG